MKKHLHNSLRALFLSLAVLLSLPMLAVKVEIDGINYELVSKLKQATVIAKSSGKYSGEVVIPESVEYEGAAYSVTSIGKRAFQNCYGLTSVTIPNSVTSIGDDTFEACSGLTSVTIGNSVTSIGWSAFEGCSGLTSVHISDIAAWCNIDFDNSGSNPLRYAHHLYLNGEEVKDLIIPNSVTSIGGAAFYDCSGLTSVTIGNSVTSIGYDAFKGCSGLTSVTIGNSVTSIGSSAFEGCSGLTSVTIGNSVTSIGGYAFSDCSELLDVYCYAEKVPSTYSYAFDSWLIEDATLHVPAASLDSYRATAPWSGFGKIVAISTEVDGIRYELLFSAKQATVIAKSSGKYSGEVVIPESVEYGGTVYSVTRIGRDAFSLCSGLTSVTIPNSVTSIGVSVFAGCSGLTSVTIPNSVTSIGGYAFYKCSGLTSVTIPNSVTSIGYYAFSLCSGLTSVTIGNGVTSIGERAFYECKGLTSVTIGSSVTSIWYDAFANCPELLDVYCYAEKVPSTKSNAFDGSYPEYATLHVPDASIDNYKATEPWSSFGNIVALTEDETGIDELKGENGTEKSAVYDLSGRRVQKGQKGIFIQNGKLMVK